ncbi:hypothetical protein B296_00048167 [Ensete ventricosum]|uniref:Uncharacterized protein n=1 Tax=Ensete ventricosum TaxID=4639 RepID=A0A426X9S1_ENSVE|nr:hypothetical protein B296_00048167 [Ensete ventricosum]
MKTQVSCRHLLLTKRQQLDWCDLMVLPRRRSRGRSEDPCEGAQCRMLVTSTSIHFSLSGGPSRLLKELSFALSGGLSRLLKELSFALSGGLSRLLKELSLLLLLHYFVLGTQSQASPPL